MSARLSGTTLHESNLYIHFTLYYNYCTSFYFTLPSHVYLFTFVYYILCILPHFVPVKHFEYCCGYLS